VIACLSSPPTKLVRDPRLDKHVVKQNRMRFVQKLKTLLLSKPKHFMHIRVLYKCRPFLSLPKPRSILSMIRRYPTVFELFMIPTPPTPFHAAGPLNQLCVRLTPAAAALAKRESDLKKNMSVFSAKKLQKLLMLAVPYHKLLLSKLVHLGTDLALPINFRSRLCNDHPDKFKVVETSYGHALELVSWDSDLANPLPYREPEPALIVDRPLKFKRLVLRKGLNVKRAHRDYLMKFRELPDVCPYETDPSRLAKESPIMAEKRACAAAREVLAMTAEKRTLIDHLTHFRREFGFPNRLRAMLARHPETFYVSLKGDRDSVFLVEGYDGDGKLLEVDETVAIRDEMMKLIVEGKRMRKEKKRREYIHGRIADEEEEEEEYGGSFDVDDDEDGDDEGFEDGLDDLFRLEDRSSDDEEGSGELFLREEESHFWVA
ncbi:hypothetical protein M569_06363, partial [Genlisea aurea]